MTCNQDCNQGRNCDCGGKEITHKTNMDYAYEFLLEGPKTVRQVADQLGTSTKSAAACLYRLRSYGKAQYEGNSKGGMYSIPNYNPLPKNVPRIGIWGL